MPDPTLTDLHVVASAVNTTLNAVTLAVLVALLKWVRGNGAGGPR